MGCPGKRFAGGQWLVLTSRSGFGLFWLALGKLVDVESCFFRLIWLALGGWVLVGSGCRLSWLALGRWVVVGVGSGFGLF